MSKPTILSKKILKDSLSGLIYETVKKQAEIEKRPIELGDSTGNRLYFKADAYEFLMQLFTDLELEIEQSGGNLSDLIECVDEYTDDEKLIKYLMAKKMDSGDVCINYLKLLNYIALKWTWNLACDLKYYRIITKNKLATLFYNEYKYIA